MRDEITVVHVNEARRAEVVRVRNELAPMHQLVGGFLEVFRITRTLILVCNEHGKLEELPLTFVVNGEAIAGPFFITADEPDDEGGRDFCGLPEGVALRLAELMNRAASDGARVINIDVSGPYP